MLSLWRQTRLDFYCGRNGVFGDPFGWCYSDPIILVCIIFHDLRFEWICCSGVIGDENLWFGNLSVAVLNQTQIIFEYCIFHDLRLDWMFCAGVMEWESVIWESLSWHSASGTSVPEYCIFHNHRFVWVSCFGFNGGNENVSPRAASGRVFLNLLFWNIIRSSICWLFFVLLSSRLSSLVFVLHSLQFFASLAKIYS